MQIICKISLKHKHLYPTRLQAVFGTKGVECVSVYIIVILYNKAGQYKSEGMTNRMNNM